MKMATALLVLLCSSMVACLPMVGGDSVVRISGAIEGTAHHDLCDLSLREVESEEIMGSVAIGAGLFTRSIVFHSRKRVRSPVELVISCSPGHLQVVATNLAIENLTDWRNKTNLGVIVVQ